MFGPAAAFQTTELSEGSGRKNTSDRQEQRPNDGVHDDSAPTGGFAASTDAGPLLETDVDLLQVLTLGGRWAASRVQDRPVSELAGAGTRTPHP